MKFLFSIGLIVAVCVSAISGYNEFLVGNREAGKCETCKYFMEFYNKAGYLNADTVEEVYREFYDAAQNSEEDACSSFCANEEFVKPPVESFAVSEEESNENALENLVAHVGCNTCMFIVRNVNMHIKYYGFRSIIGAFKYGCFHDATQRCKSFLAHHEDELVDAIYHFKNNTLPTCKSIHQC